MVFYRAQIRVRAEAVKLALSLRNRIYRGGNGGGLTDSVDTDNCVCNCITDMRGGRCVAAVNMPEGWSNHHREKRCGYACAWGFAGDVCEQVYVWLHSLRCGDYTYYVADVKGWLRLLFLM